ncbi:MAG: tetraacyldisaccharide 4'-kinase [Betaproteobacteria bacterium]
MTLRERLAEAWYAPRLTPLAAALSPLAALFAGLVGTRRLLYRIGLLPRERLPVPVLVVGNITAGGTGKTPLVMALARALEGRGWHPGVVSRGHGRGGGWDVRVVDEAATVAMVGDEPLLMARNGIRVAVGARRAEAGRAMLAAYPQCDLLIADDGLQHYALARDVEIAVVDGARGCGNGMHLPAGPLRESPRRLRTVDVVVVNGDDRGLATRRGAFSLHLAGELFTSVLQPAHTVRASAFTGAHVHAIAGIGRPERFFETLRDLGLTPICHPYPDHHRYTREELALPGATAILMTEKDAVNCADAADERCWYLPVVATIDAALVDCILALVASRAGTAGSCHRPPISTARG